MQERVDGSFQESPADMFDCDVDKAGEYPIEAVHKVPKFFLIVLVAQQIEGETGKQDPQKHHNR